MAASTTAYYNLLCKIEEALALTLDQASDPTITHEITGSSGTLTSATSVPVTKSWSDQVALSAGTVTLDLTALTRSPLANVDFTGLKVQLVKIKALAANTATITVADGASNGYNLFGDSSGQVTLDAGQEILQLGNDKLADVSSTVKNITVTSSQATAGFNIILVAG